MLRYRYSRVKGTASFRRLETRNVNRMKGGKLANDYGKVSD